MNFAQRLKETLQTGLDIGFKAGVQKGCDLWMAALAQEGFGAERMIRMYERVEAINNELGIAWMCEPESDYAQEQLDRIWSRSAGTVSRHFATEIRMSSSLTIKGGNENE